MVDGVRLVLQICVIFAAAFDLEGWKQHEHMLKKVKKIARSFTNEAKQVSRCSLAGWS